MEGTMIGKLALTAIAVAALSFAAVNAAKVSSTFPEQGRQNIARTILCKVTGDRSGVRCGLRELSFGNTVELADATPRELQANEIVTCTYHTGGRICRRIKGSGACRPSLSFLSHFPPSLSHCGVHAFHPRIRVLIGQRLVE
jgi:hypothetical protein